MEDYLENYSVFIHAVSPKGFFAVQNFVYNNVKSTDKIAYFGSKIQLISEYFMEYGITLDIRAYSERDINEWMYEIAGIEDDSKVRVENWSIIY